MIVPRFIAGFAGHRELGNPTLIEEAIRKTWVNLQDRVTQIGGLLEMYSSVAYGADTLAVEAARAAGLPVHLILPKPVVMLPDGKVDIQAGFAADFWGDGAPGEGPQFRERDWERALGRIIEARSGSAGGTLRLTRGSQNEPECYYDAGLDVLNNCDVLVAVWDGQGERGVGGTAQMIDYARIQKLPLLIIDAANGHISEKNLDAFASKEDPGCAAIRGVDAFSRESIR
jgi:hypothetical protein